MTDEAIAEIKKLTEAFPDDSKYLAMLAEYYLDNEMEDEALKTYIKNSRRRSW